MGGNQALMSMGESISLASSFSLTWQTGTTVASLAFTTQQPKLFTLSNSLKNIFCKEFILTTSIAAVRFLYFRRAQQIMRT